MIEDALRKDVLSFIENKGPAVIDIVFPCIEVVKFCSLEANSILLIPPEWSRGKSASLITKDILSGCEIAITVSNNYALYLFVRAEITSLEDMATYWDDDANKNTLAVFVIPSYRPGWKNTSANLPSPVKRSRIPFL